MSNFKVKNIDLASTGRELIEKTIENLPKLKDYYKSLQGTYPLSGLRITFNVDITSLSGVMSYFCYKLGAEVRVMPSLDGFINNEVAAYLALNAIPTFAWPNQTKDEFRWSTEKALIFNQGGFPHILIDYGELKGELFIEKSETDKLECLTEHKVEQLIKEQKSIQSKLESMSSIIKQMVTLLKEEGEILLGDTKNNMEVACYFLLRNIQLSRPDPLVCHCCSVVMLRDPL